MLLLTAVSCSQEIVPELPVEEGGITLTLHNMVPQTKTQPGVEDLNENLIETIHYFLYPKDGTDQNTEKEPAKEGVLTGLSSQVDHTFRINVSEDLLKNTLFKYPYNDCDVYVIVNLPDGVLATASDHKLSTLRSMVVNANFNSSLEQEAFVMEGLGTASIIDRRKVLAASGTIEVSRLASKITVGVKVKESIQTMDNQTSTNGQVWTSKPQDMLIELVNGASVAVLSGNPTMVESQILYTDNNQQRIFSDTDGDQIWSCAQFYSYPSKWDIGSDEEPYLRITLPWETTYDKNVNGEPIPYVDVQTCVYKVILGGEELTRNTWYDLTIDIGILGNFENQEEVLLPIENTNYFVADWSTGKTISSEILGGRYLVVDQKEYILYNENTLSIPFTSSHTCEIVDIKVTRPDISTRTPNMSAPVTVDNTWALNIMTNEINDYIKFEHKLDNEISNPPFDYAPYTITFLVRHIDKPDSYYRNIKIIQYPAITIDIKPNSDQTLRDNKYGNTFVNATSNNASGMESSFSDTNSNPNMYVLSISSLDESSKYIISDPREINIDNLGQTWSNSRTSIQGTTRRITYYYPTIADVSAENLIAPKFRIASSYGKWSGGTYLEAQRRCASYQEDGYPAGRWRVPTKAEIEFIITASVNNIIPSLFTPDDSNGYAYWCSTGGIYPRTNGSVDYIYNDTTNEHSVRCVYDEWYWENTSVPTVDIATYTWGDAQR